MYTRFHSCSPEPIGAYCAFLKLCDSNWDVKPCAWQSVSSRSRNWNCHLKQPSKWNLKLLVLWHRFQPYLRCCCCPEALHVKMDKAAAAAQTLTRTSGAERHYHLSIILSKKNKVYLLIGSDNVRASVKHRVQTDNPVCGFHSHTHKPRVHTVAAGVHVCVWHGEPAALPKEVKQS